VGSRERGWVRGMAIVLMLAFLLQGVPAVAQVYGLDEEVPKVTGIEKMLTKLGRGLSNIMLGWAEIPVTWDKKLKAGRPLGYLLGVAPILGTARALMRTSVGVFEVVSFPFSDRDINYEAVLEPEYIF